MTEDVLSAREDPKVQEVDAQEPLSTDAGAAEESIKEAEQADETVGDEAVDEAEAAGLTAEVEDGESHAVDESPEEAPSEADIIMQLQEELAAAQAQVEAYVDQLQRTAAEFQNSRRRQERRLADDIDRANADLIRRLLPILDDYDLAFQNAPSSEHAAEGEDRGEDEQSAEGAWVMGFRQIQKKLLDLLQEQGVTTIDVDGEFDPARHEAISSEPSDDVDSGHIIGVLRAGYEYKGQVLRPAMVRVAT